MKSQTINGKKAQKMISKGNTLLIDMRDAVAFRDGTLPGAINLSLRRVSELIKHPRNTCIIMFGDSEDDPTLTSALSYVRQFGFEKVFSLGTKENWSK